MTPHQVGVLRESWSELQKLPRGHLVGEFYRHLFELAPGLRALFAEDLHVQGSRMTKMLEDML